MKFKQYLQRSKLVAGDQCIDIDAPWTKVVFFLVNDVSDKRIQITSVPGPTKANIATSNRRDASKIVKNPFRVRLDDFDAQSFIIRNHAYRIRNASAKKIYDAKGELDLRSLLTWLENTFPESDREFIELCVKCAVGVGSIRIQPVPRATGLKRYKLQISENAVDREKLASYAATFADELKTQSERIALLIKHWPTVGSYREELFRSLLRRTLPERYHVATGFINGSERQIDILIYDRIDNAPLFREGDLVVVDYSAVRAIIEIKSNLNYSELKDSLDLVTNYGSPDQGRPPIFKGIFAYDSTLSRKSIRDSIIRFYSQNNPNVATYAALTDFSSIATAVCVQQQSILLTGYARASSGNEMYLPYVYAVESMLGRQPEAAIFFDALRNSLRDHTVPADRDTLSALMNLELNRVDARPVYPGTWGPYIAPELPNSPTPEEIKAEAVSVINWLKGRPWTGSS